MMAEWIGRTLSKVRIERLIGRGGMAEVYLGRHTTLDRPVAVKVLHAHLSEDPDAAAIEAAGVLLDEVEEASGLAQRIAAADSLEEVGPLAEALGAIEVEASVAALTQSLVGRTYTVELGVVSGAP